jgi:hypothetical protein
MSAVQSVPRSYSINQLFIMPVGLILIFFLLSLTERVQSNEVLFNTFFSITGLLILFYVITHFIQLRNNKQASILFIVAKPHYVQMIMHLSIFAYWGWYWPQVYDQVVLILAQLVYVHIFDLCFRWSQGKPFIIGFGRFPIIFSTNLFLWFQDDWFYYQFIMITFGLLAKEYFTWIKDGRRTHIFNPSAISLSVASLLLIITGTTDITWGSQISNTLNSPPHIYLEIFILGLIVQYLFHVTLVTLATVISLLVLGALYYQFTGVYFFYTSDIPIAVFLGLHLLVTDPVTSPRTNIGKLLFGLLYGLSVMLLFEILEYFGAPTFYDKLLAVPLLNLSIMFLDQLGKKISLKNIWPDFITVSLNAKKLNLLFMAIWIAIFFSWQAVGHLGNEHPGRQSQFWEQACNKDLRNGCRNLHELIGKECNNNVALACARLGSLHRLGKGIDRDDIKAYNYVKRACDLGLQEACIHLHEYKPK